MRLLTKAIAIMFILMVRSCRETQCSLECYVGDYTKDANLNVIKCNRKTQMCFTAIPNGKESEASYQGCTHFNFGAENDAFIYNDRLEVSLITYYVCKENLCNRVENYRKLLAKEIPKKTIATVNTNVVADEVKLPKKITKEQLSSSLTFQSVVTLPVKETLSKPKNCVLFFTHFESEPTTIDTISSIYNDLGLDVIIIKPKQSHLFLPESGKSLVDDLISKLSGNNLPLNVGQFLVHSTASGAFYYAIFTDQLNKIGGSFQLNRIRGQVFDGLVLNDPATTLGFYRSSLPKFFVLGKDIFENSARNFIENPLNVETLIFHTMDNARCEEADSLIDRWSKCNYLNINISSWERSVNKENYLSHPKQYERTLETFIMKTGLI
ncbi:hypothetical protein HELRODRAFT_165664 [Helobdella robusta]|uniref:Uncharacterized protein n=1 Tax=Helobdella robusta TaxID=6412 RepID=T1EX54_HELRO|nr:hypothetical protein HELRODRAFT_165664 [Helobdella robusta]ESN91611.1 hypothetical protein HELRODRAFT_165664 [Helobdella robusta]